MRSSYVPLLTSAAVCVCWAMLPDTSRGELLLRWTFDEAVSGDQNAANLGTAPGAVGIFNGGATRTDNTPGGASPGAADLLAAGNGYVSAADSSALDGLDQITITAWINIQGDPAAGSVNNRIAALQDGTAAFNGFSFNVNPPAFGDYSADNFRLGMFVGGTDAFASGFSDDIFGLPNEWIFVATSYDGLAGQLDLDNLVFYLGTETMETTEHFFPLTSIGGPVAPVAPGTGFHLGRTDAAPDANTSLEGFIDDIRVYDEILSLEQLETVRMEGLTAPPPLQVAGDYNDNGRVEQGDLDLVLLNWGQSFDTLPDDWMNERPTDGIIDQAELDGVLLNWGNTAGLSTAAVPEPTSLGLAMALAAMALLRRRR